MSDNHTTSDFFIVGIGASAGGIKALKEFFQNVAADSGMAYVAILHLSPDFESKLADILASVAPIPVRQIGDERIKVEPNHVYVVAPNRSLTMQDGHLAHQAVQSFEQRRAPIDIFFRTLGESHGAQAVSVILSGTGANGSMGIKRVKETGGVVFVQEPREAEYDDMPRNSIATELVDYVLPVAEIPAKIVAYREQSNRVSVPIEIAERAGDDEAALMQIFTVLRRRTGHDFTNYKRATILRRLERRMKVCEIGSLPAYAAYLDKKSEEIQHLLKDFLISVTNFFRDKKAFEAVEKIVIPKMIADKTAKDTVRIWTAGCATGEEAYSLAMLLAEQTSEQPDAPMFQIFATDLDEAAVAQARDGLYTLTDAADVAPQRLRRFFVKEEENYYRVRRELRERVLFAAHNLLKDPPFSHLDLISCRNLLIYFNRTAQKRVMETFNFALSADGYLFLGSSESVDGAGEMFSLADRDHQIYQSRGLISRARIPVPDLSAPSRSHLPNLLLGNGKPESAGKRAVERLSLVALHQQLLEMYAPSVVVNEDHDIVHLSERAGRYLHIVGGEPSFNLLKIARPELRLELRSALYQAAQKRASIEVRDIPIRIDDRDETVNIIVRPIFDAAAANFILVLFEASDAPPRAAEVIGSVEPIAFQLEEELMRLKVQLRSTVEQYETQTEELKASNEEFQAMNEELRSAAEELETSKEELQSVNEELSTVNQELKIKIEELSQANNDFQNLINSTDFGTIFLDRDLRIKLFTTSIREIFNLISSDHNRSLSDITHKLDDATLMSDVQSVLETLQTIEREVRTINGAQTFLMRILPYRTAEDRINGVVMTFFDVTVRTAVETALRESEAQFRAIADLVPDLLWSNDANGKTDWYNCGWLEYTGRQFSEATALGWLEAIHPDDREKSLKNFQQAVADGKPVRQEHRIRSASGEYRWFLVRANAVTDGARWYGAATDVHELRGALEALSGSEERLRVVIEAAELGTWDWDLVADQCLWNKRNYQLYGLKPDGELKTEADYAALLHPDDAAATLAKFHAAAATGDVYQTEFRIIRADNQQIRWMSHYGKAIELDLSGAATRMIGIMYDITKAKEIEAEQEQRVTQRTVELADANRRLQFEVVERRQAEDERIKLLQQIVTAQEDERRRIARDLHDQLGQQLTALRLKLEMFRERWGAEIAFGEEIVKTQKIAERIDADVSFLAWELRPTALDDLGLVAALGNYVAEWSKHFEIPAEFHTQLKSKERLTPAAETNFYRIAQEAMNNITKHAHASRANVLLEKRDGHAILIIEDDGVGFDPPSVMDVRESGRGLGLVGMRERMALVGGSLEIETNANVGTTIYARVPLNPGTQKGQRS